MGLWLNFLGFIFEKDYNSESCEARVWNFYCNSSSFVLLSYFIFGHYVLAISIMNSQLNLVVHNYNCSVKVWCLVFFALAWAYSLIFSFFLCSFLLLNHLFIFKQIVAYFLIYIFIIEAWVVCDLSGYILLVSYNSCSLVRCDAIPGFFFFLASQSYILFCSTLPSSCNLFLSKLELGLFVFSVCSCWKSVPALWVCTSMHACTFFLFSCSCSATISSCMPHIQFGF